LYQWGIGIKMKKLGREELDWGGEGNPDRGGKEAFWEEESGL